MLRIWRQIIFPDKNIVYHQDLTAVIISDFSPPVPDEVKSITLLKYHLK